MRFGGGKIGTYQVITHWRERQYSDIEWEVGDGDVAGDMVFGVSEWETEKEGAGYDSGGEDVKRLGDMMDGVGSFSGSNVEGMPCALLTTWVKNSVRPI